MAMTDVDSATDKPITLVIFGASGDLTRRKLVPALASLQSKGRLPSNLQILGVARSDLNDQGFRTLLEEFLGGEGMARPSPAQWAELSSRIHYTHGDVTSSQDLDLVKSRLAEIEGEAADCNRLYYLSLAPSLYRHAIHGLEKRTWLTTPAVGGAWSSRNLRHRPGIRSGTQ